MNLQYEYLKGTYLILALSKEGPSRVDGAETYDSLEKAEDAVRYCTRSAPNGQIGLIA